MSFESRCHCGKIGVEVDDALPTRALACNCSICRRRGSLHHFTTPDKVTVKGSREDLTTYLWNRKVIRHQFCSHCGCAPFAEGEGPNGPIISVNLRCVDAIDPASLQIENFDGANRL